MARRWQSAGWMAVVVVAIAARPAAPLPPEPFEAAVRSAAAATAAAAASAAAAAEERQHEPDDECRGGCDRDRLERQMGEAASLEALKRARMELFGRQVLSRLGLQAPPQVPPGLSALRSTIALPRELLGDEAPLEEHDADPSAAHSGHFYVFASDASPRECSGPVRGERLVCLEFDIASAQVRDAVRAAKLSLYVHTRRAVAARPGGVDDEPLHVRLAGGSDGGAVVSTSVSSSQTTDGGDDDGSWLRFELSTVAAQAAFRSGRLSLELVCRGSHHDDDCSSVVPPSVADARKPFILVTENFGQARKFKRDDNTHEICENEEQRGRGGRSSKLRCCLQKQYVEFHRDLNFTFILEPRGFEINFCRGSCDPRSVGFRPVYTHAYLLQMVSKDAEDLFTLCCAPVRLHALSVIYMLPSGIYKDAVLPNMSVGECGCS